MTDREIIIDEFVDKYYEVNDGPSHNLEFGVKHKTDNCESYVTLTSFINFVVELYSNFDTDEGVTVYSMVNDWLMKQHDEAYYDVITYLDDNVNVTIGLTEWEIKVNGEPWSWEELIDKFDGRYSNNRIKFLYDRWYVDKLKSVSEKEMKNLFT